MEDLNVNMAIWWMFRIATLLGKDYDTNLQYAKKHNWDSLGLIWWSRKTDLWTIRNPWSKNTRDRCFEDDWTRRHYMEIDKFIERKVYHVTTSKVWELTQTQRGWIKLNDIRRTTSSRNWIASMVCRLSSSGKFQDSRRKASSKRFKISWKVFSVNMSISTAESSSCQCSLILCGEKTTIQKNVLRTL